MRELNRAVWESAGTVARYSRSTLSVRRAESLIFEKHKARLAGKRILDVACGTGRTTAVLTDYSDLYTAIDYSAGMVEECRRKYPGVRVLQCDMRDMSIFGDAAFDFVLCSENSIDYLDHAERLTTLDEVRRVLAPAGLFVFSSHNRNYTDARAVPCLAWTLAPARMARRVKYFLIQTRNHLRNRRRQVFAQTYAILNDAAEAYSLLTYYVDKRMQVEQLREAGFETVELYDEGGQALDVPQSDVHTPWIYYVARRRTGCEEPRADR
ncbi:MAG: class I SAM-dependent methyltransferase [Kiritimatiellae bacterium]|nr:class I SAM-dependent methyltransferase [Kiritimatiellia bacterium]